MFVALWEFVALCVKISLAYFWSSWKSEMEMVVSIPKDVLHLESRAQHHQLLSQLGLFNNNTGAHMIVFHHVFILQTSPHANRFALYPQKYKTARAWEICMVILKFFGQGFYICYLREESSCWHQPGENGSRWWWGPGLKDVGLKDVLFLEER